jgi:hypothetical protein
MGVMVYGDMNLAELTLREAQCPAYVVWKLRLNISAYEHMTQGFDQNL